MSAGDLDLWYFPDLGEAPPVAALASAAPPPRPPSRFSFPTSSSAVDAAADKNEQHSNTELMGQWKILGCAKPGFSKHLKDNSTWYHQETKPLHEKDALWHAKRTLKLAYAPVTRRSKGPKCSTLKYLGLVRTKFSVLESRTLSPSWTVVVASVINNQHFGLGILNGVGECVCGWGGGGGGDILELLDFEKETFWVKHARPLSDQCLLASHSSTYLENVRGSLC